MKDNALFAAALVLPDGIYDFTVEWGDGKSDQITSFDDAETNHTYKNANVYVVHLVEGFSFDYDEKKGVSLLLLLLPDGIYVF